MPETDDDDEGPPWVDPGLVLAMATLEALAARLGNDFAGEVRQCVLAHADRLEATGERQSKAIAADARDIADRPFWSRWLT